MKRNKLLKEIEDEMIRKHLIDKYYAETHNLALDILKRKYKGHPFKYMFCGEEHFKLHSKLLKDRINFELNQTSEEKT